MKSSDKPHGKELTAGTRVIVSGEQDGKTFHCEDGVVSQVLSLYTIVRFDNWRDGHGAENADWCFYESDRQDWTITAPLAVSTGLSASDLRAGDEVKLPQWHKTETVERIDGTGVVVKYEGEDYRYGGFSDWVLVKRAEPALAAGDRVKYVGSVFDELKGECGTLVSDLEDGEVLFDDKRSGRADGMYTCLPESLEKIERPTSTPEPTVRPRFMTAFLVDDDRVFVPTGDAFMTKEDADADALVKLEEIGTQDQIAVLELRTVHMSRLTITSEAA